MKPREPEEIKQLRRAAEQGDASAQYNLGVMYDTGQGVPQDYVQAHKWINLATSRTTPREAEEYRSARDSLAERMTASQIAEAQRLARKWQPKTREQLEVLSTQYYEDFLADPDLNKKALERAHDIRKFEIDLYWKRATYFWTFIAATLAGFILIQTSSSLKNSIKADISVLLASFGIVFSFGWYWVNCGSKFWQENWESHVDMLEDAIDGPLYKAVIHRCRPSNCKERFYHWLTGPAKISASQINQLISLFVTFMWLGLLLYSLPPVRSNVPIDYGYGALIVLTVATCVVIFCARKKISAGGYCCRTTKRSVKIKDDQ